MEKMIKRLDKGYVIMHEDGCTGSDLTIVNAARVSYDRKSTEMEARDERLIDFLIREKHTSPLRHAFMQFEVYAPLMVARQWFKHIAGSDHTMDAWNESSRRYITENEEFYIPAANEWRSKPENSKQGSGDPIADSIGDDFTHNLTRYIQQGERLYNHAMQLGIAPEQARLFLPANGMYVRWYWSASLQAVLHFLDQRLASDAQYEIRVYAQAVEQFVKEKFPITYEKWGKYNG